MWCNHNLRFNSCTCVGNGNDHALNNLLWFLKLQKAIALLSCKQNEMNLGVKVDSMQQLSMVVLHMRGKVIERNSSLQSHGCIVRIIKENSMYFIDYLPHQMVFIVINKDVTKTHTAKFSLPFEINDIQLSYMWLLCFLQHRPTPWDLCFSFDRVLFLW